MNAMEEVSLEKEFNVDCIWADKDIGNLNDALYMSSMW